MNRLEVLLAVRGLLSSHDRWLKHGMAANEDGKKVSIQHPRACAFSLDGAFHRIAYITGAQCGPAYELLKYCIDRTRKIPVSSFNSALGTNHWVVTQMLDKAIIMAGGTPPVIEEEE